jgi:hypothetical protein
VDRLLDTLVQCFTHEVVSRIANLRASSELPNQIDQLAAKANEGEQLADSSNCVGGISSSHG